MKHFVHDYKPAEYLQDLGNVRAIEYSDISYKYYAFMTSGEWVYGGSFHSILEAEIACDDLVESSEDVLAGIVVNKNGHIIGGITKKMIKKQLQERVANLNNQSVWTGGAILKSLSLVAPSNRVE